MTSVLVLFVSAFLFCCIYSAQEADISQRKGFLGTVGSKSYLVERVKGNWTQGKTYCENLGMKLAKIETYDELNFLNSKYQDGIFSGWHWTAARDAHRSQQFVWNDNNSTIAIGLSWSPFSKLVTSYLSCGAFVITRVNNYAMWMIECENTDGYVLCEI